MKLRYVLMGLILAASDGSSAATLASSPQLDLILPRGVQRGQQWQMTFQGARLEDTQEIFFYSPGFEVLQLQAEAGQVVATVKVAADCHLGEHVAQLRAASGISEFRTFFVGALPPLDEQEPNTVFEQPQEIPLNHTVQGVIENEDVDYFAVQLRKGQRISVEVEAMRLDGVLFDPSVAILDERRFELVAQDDTPLLLQDCAASLVAPEDGRYVIQVRESSYGGNGNCRYRLHVGEFPRPLAVYPAGGKRGESLDVVFVGDAAGEIRSAVSIPAEAPSEDYSLFAEDAGGISPSGVPFRPFEHGNVLEVEPNNTIAEATYAELPLAMNGVIQEPGDVDFFRFAAKKDQVFDVECYARRLRAPLDPVIVIHKADGSQIVANDDARGPDSYLRFTAPEDGEYALLVTDHLRRGGPEFVYRVEFLPVRPSLTVSIPRVARYSQYRQSVFVPRGNRFATLVNVARQNFGGDVILAPDGLPEGVKMVARAMPANMNSMPVVFEAEAEAPLAGRLTDFRARHVDENAGIEGGYANRADFIIAAPNQSLYQYRDVDRLPVAVVDALPVTLEIVQPKAPIVRDGSMELKIVAHRAEGFNSAITIEFPFRPPGIGAASTVVVPEGQNEVLYPLNANGTAAIGNWPIYAIGTADVNGAAWFSSQLADLNIAERFVSLEIQNAACEQGQPVSILCKINHLAPFEGEATARLLGLPPNTLSPDLKFSKDTQELVFPVTTQADSPAGKHKTVFCELQIPVEGEIVVSRGGGVELQIDVPLPAPAQAAPASEPTPEAQPEAPPAEKPLSRLEKLRQAARERTQGGQ